jgi:hypothetical protein
MVLLAEPGKTTDKSATAEAHDRSIAALKARLDAEQKLKEKVRAEERACFEETARILGHKPPSAEQVKAAARRREMIDRIAKLGENATFIGEGFADDYGETSRGHFGGGQIMDLPAVERLYDLNDLARKLLSWSSYHSEVFLPPYQLWSEGPDHAEALRYRGADLRSGEVFAKADSRGVNYVYAYLGVSFSLPARRLDGTLPRVSGPSRAPSLRTCPARIVASIEGTKRWMLEAENTDDGACQGDLQFFIIPHPLYDPQDVEDVKYPSCTTPATHWRVRSSRPYGSPDPLHWFVSFDDPSHWPFPTALPKTAESDWFTVNNHHTYDIYVGVRVEAQGYIPPPPAGYGYSVAIAELKAVIQSITVEFTD